MIITLCGSTKFKEEFIEVNKQLTIAGHVVISVGLFGHADGLLGNEITDEIKEMLDRLHKQKIDISEAIVVLNVGGYIGSSTYNELIHAYETGKKIYLLDTKTGAGERTIVKYKEEELLSIVYEPAGNKANLYKYIPRVGTWTLELGVHQYTELLQIGGSNV